ncbi:M24 family metallopeptidase [Herbiconiux daphne]|uniref:Xaa-Pro peptidase family protein n=1 Tax=Herbiconiux daphne TaxID=2970914 RepID=A0ABT2GW82_9MICO|nr:Xaa-Pro peptidase family protein [Herbiconiux daphne]MCS5732219.1 Xaa-Pro peptidase family protein [Herbiconiux daphne]
MTPHHAARQTRLWAALDEAGIDVLFLPPQADLEYVTGLERRLPSFGEIGYAHHWVAGALIVPGAAPVFVLPRMIREFDLPAGVDGDVVTVSELDDGAAMFRAALDSAAPRATRIGIGPRAWAQTAIHLLEARPGAQLIDAGALTNRLRRVKDADELDLMRRAARLVDAVLADVEPFVVAGATELDLASEIDLRMRRLGSRGASFDTGVWSMGPSTARDASVRLSNAVLAPGAGVSFDFGAIVDGYCSDFGRTVHIGEPGEEYVRVHELVMAAQEAGRQAARPGATAADVDRATRAVIVDGGYGEWFRHRTGHCIGKDVHELPYISEEDHTVLEPGMSFTIEPSVFWPGRVGVRVEDVFVVTEGDTVSLNEHPRTLVANG